MKHTKKLILTAPLLCLLLVAPTGCDKGSVFNGEQTTTDYTTRLEMAGMDGRIYEFTPKTADYMQCVFVAGSQKGGLYCFEKKGN